MDSEGFLRGRKQGFWKVISGEQPFLLVERERERERERDNGEFED